MTKNVVVVVVVVVVVLPTRSQTKTNRDLIKTRFLVLESPGASCILLVVAVRILNSECFLFSLCTYESSTQSCSQPHANTTFSTSVLLLVDTYGSTECLSLDFSFPSSTPDSEIPLSKL